MPQISVRIDNELYSAAEGQTIFQVAQANGRTIPSLCYMEGLSAPGSCRLCLVEVAGVGRLLPAAIWEVIDARRDSEEEPWEAKDEVVPMDLVSYVAGPDGVEETADALAKVDTPVAPELFREGVL